MVGGVDDMVAMYGIKWVVNARVSVAEPVKEYDLDMEACDRDVWAIGRYCLPEMWHPQDNVQLGNETTPTCWRSRNWSLSKVKLLLENMTWHVTKKLNQGGVLVAAEVK